MDENKIVQLSVSERWIKQYYREQAAKNREQAATKAGLAGSYIARARRCASLWI